MYSYLNVLSNLNIIILFPILIKFINIILFLFIHLLADHGQSIFLRKVSQKSITAIQTAE
jgi:hypothetical protein